MALCLLSLGWAALAGRPMFYDGIFWTFKIFNSRSFYCDWNFTRYTDALLQIPAVLMLKYDLGDALALKINNLLYSLHPVASFLACFYILKKRNRLDLMIFPVFSFAVVTQSVIAVPFMIISGLLSLLWPLFFLATMPGQGFYYWFWISILNFALIFEHEAAFIFLFFLSLLKLYEFYTDSQQNRKTHRYLFLIFSVSTVWMIYHVFQLPKMSRSNFTNAFTSTMHLDIFILSSMAFILLFLINLKKLTGMIELFKKALVIISTLTVTANFIKYYLDWKIGGEFFWGVIKARTYAVPEVCLICLGCYVYIKSNRSLNSAENKKIYGLGLFITSLALITSLLHDLTMTTIWNNAMDNIKLRISEAPACRQISLQETNENLIPHAVDTRYLPIYSIVIGHSLYNHVGTVLFSEDSIRNFKNYSGISDLCCELPKRKLAIAGVFFEIEPDWYYNLKPVIENINSDSSNKKCP